MLSHHHQNFDSDKRILQCKGTYDQLSQTKNEIDKLLRETQNGIKDSEFKEIESVILNSIPIAFGTYIIYIEN